MRIRDWRARWREGSRPSLPLGLMGPAVDEGPVEDEAEVERRRVCLLV